MEESKNTAVITVRGAVRKKALRQFYAQMKSWNLTMPSQEPLVLDFGLNDFFQTGLIESWVANEIEAGYCGKFLFVFGGQTCPTHRHGFKHETFFIVRGKVKMYMANSLRIMRPGDCLTIPPRKNHRFIGVEPSLLLEVSKPCIVADNIFHDPHIPIGKNFTGHLLKKAQIVNRRK
ncbi:MAG: cupin domain-containing protein [Pirellulales bacterium]|nr:cupin domain-containing protein [Pirellulales bacterium]